MTTNLPHNPVKSGDTVQLNGEKLTVEESHWDTTNQTYIATVIRKDGSHFDVLAFELERVYTKDGIKALLTANDKAVERAVLAIYARQTASEQATDQTSEHNGIGFNGIDAELLSSFAKQLQQGRTLSAKQMEYARKKITKYAGQLAQIANEKAAVQAAA